jgi:predicted transcriptional regulator
MPITLGFDEDYHCVMARLKEFDFESRARVIEDEDEKTLAAIDEGVRDAEAGRTVLIEKVRKRLTQWITASSSHKGR